MGLYHPVRCLFEPLYIKLELLQYKFRFEFAKICNKSIAAFWMSV